MDIKTYFSPASRQRSKTGASLNNNDPDPTPDEALVSPGNKRKRQTKMTAFLTSSGEPGPGGSSRNRISKNEKKKKSKKRKLGEVGTGKISKKRKLGEVKAVQDIYDFYIISDDPKWDKQVLKTLKKKKPGLKYLSSKDWIPGKYKIDNLTNPLKRCKIVVVGFTSEPETGKFVAAAAMQQVIQDKTLSEGKVIPVRIKRDAVIPDWLQPIEVASYWEKDFYDKLLNALSEQAKFGITITSKERRKITKKENQPPCRPTKKPKKCK